MKRLNPEEGSRVITPDHRTEIDTTPETTGRHNPAGLTEGQRVNYLTTPTSSGTDAHGVRPLDDPQPPHRSTTT